MRRKSVVKLRDGGMKKKNSDSDYRLELDPVEDLHVSYRRTSWGSTFRFGNMSGNCSIIWWFYFTIHHYFVRTVLYLGCSRLPSAGKQVQYSK